MALTYQHVMRIAAMEAWHWQVLPAKVEIPPEPILAKLLSEEEAAQRVKAITRPLRTLGREARQPVATVCRLQKAGKGS